MRPVCSYFRSEHSTRRDLASLSLTTISVTLVIPVDTMFVYFVVLTTRIALETIRLSVFESPASFAAGQL